ncbi:hypothetical protein [Burkholderia thailandensis]|uniref:hypothetical protein n=1 Tax=Burkholderia thailandensis TaxID=57975 RepID=UPI0004F68943|nr:hypothetical protein [Burkholderia thailandensis]
MGVFQWIVDEDGPEAPYSDLPGIDNLLTGIHRMMEWEGEIPGSVAISPTFAQLEAGAEYALGELAKAELKYRAAMESSGEPISDDYAIDPVDMLIEHMESATEEDLLRDYPKGLPENQVYVLGALALVYVDRAIGHLLHNRSVDAVNAMARACSATHAAGFFDGQDQGIAWIQRTNSSKGGAVRNEPYKKLQKWAKARYQARTWKSPHQASHELRDSVLEQAAALGVTLSPYRAQQTIYGWLLSADKEPSPK